MSQLTIVAKIVAKKDTIEFVKTELLRLVVPTRKENGCLEYRLQQDNNDPTVFIFYETWASAACVQQHVTTDHYKQYVTTVASMIEEKVVYTMTRID